jgi:hypothetical protein
MRFLAILSLLFVLAACNLAEEPQVLPTLVEFPSPTIRVITTTPVNTSAVVSMAEMTFPPSFTPTEATTASPSLSPSATITATPTLKPILPTATGYATAFPLVEEATYNEITFEEALDLLRETPILNLPTEHTRLIYARGMQRGLQSDFLLAVGDCNSESHFYLRDLLDDTPPSEGVDVTYYENPDVQSTIATYSEAFDFKGQSANSGLNSMSVMDPFWANPDVCPAGESPLSCDYRFTHPFAALIMFGANDINVLNTADYELALRDIIEFTLDRDIIPILSTFTVRPIGDNAVYSHGVRFNGVIIRLAAEYQIPLVNFWLAARDLPDNGIMPDNAHLSIGGFNVRNQLTIEMIHALQSDVMQREQS